MLEVLPQAQSAGQKSQEDAHPRPGVDLRPRRGAAAGGGMPPQHPPILGEEFEQRELLALEKETMGTFLSDHPLSEVRDALRVRADCSLAELDEEGRRRLGDRRRDRRREQEDPDQERLAT